MNTILEHYWMIKQLQQNKIKNRLMGNKHTPEKIWQRCVLSVLTAYKSMQVIIN